MKYKTSLKSFAVNLSLVFVSIVFIFLIFEFIIFRFVLKASDLPKIESVNQIIKYKPHQTGITRIKNETAARYSINANGWNSPHKRYTLQPSPHKRRIAIIGDSYIEAFRVDFTVSVAEQLEKRLGKDRFEVYRFGIGGAPMSQSLHILRREVLGLHPTLVIIALCHNDFDESYRFLQGLYDSNFLKLEIRDGRVIREIPPREYSPRWYTPIRFSATWRYLHFRKLIKLQFLKDVILGKEEQNFQANIAATHKNPELAQIATATDYVFRFIRLRRTWFGAGRKF